MSTLRAPPPFPPVLAFDELFCRFIEDTALPPPEAAQRAVEYLDRTLAGWLEEASTDDVYALVQQTRVHLQNAAACFSMLAPVHAFEDCPADCVECDVIIPYGLSTQKEPPPVDLPASSVDEERRPYTPPKLTCLASASVPHGRGHP